MAKQPEIVAAGPLTPPLSLYARINRVKAGLKRVAKSGTNQHFGYKFATESDISDALRELMDEHGVCLLYHGPEKDDISVSEMGSSASGKAKLLAKCWIKYEVINVDDPTQREWVYGYGEAMDMEDKGHNKAITNCHKYVLMKLFDVSTGDPQEDPDFHGHADAPATRPPPKPKAVIPRPPPAIVDAPLPAYRAPLPGHEPIGHAGLKPLLDGMNERHITLKDVRAGLYKKGLKDVLKGKETDPKNWPAGIIDDIKQIFAATPKPAKTSPLLDACVQAWNRQSLAYDGGPMPSFGPGDCQGPGDLYERMLRSTDFEGPDRETLAVAALNDGLVEVLTGSVLPF